MNKKIKSLLYSFDFSGLVPQFRVLNYDSYHSIFSLIVSIIIIMSSIGFSIYSIVNYFQFNNPSITFIKRMDSQLNRTIFLKDTFFMFRAYGFCNNENFDDVGFFHYATFYEKEDFHLLELELCEIGKNINIKYKDLFNKNSDNINQYYCINSKHGNLPLYYDPEQTGFQKSYFEIDIHFNNSVCNNINYFIDFITENDIINHYNKKNPIDISSYSFSSPMYTSNMFLSLDYNFEFIRYDTDYGYFFHNLKNRIAIGMSDLSREIKYEQNAIVSGYIAKIIYSQNAKNYSHYIRTYQKIQSLLAEISSVVNVLLGIGRLMSSFLLNKQMSKDIIRSLINKGVDTKIKGHSLFENNYKEKKLFKNICEKVNNSERKVIDNEITEKSNIKSKSNKILNIKMHFNKKESKINKSKIVKVNILKNINFLDIMKSYICCNTKKSILINACHNFIMKELCIERMLDRLCELEKLFYLLSKEDYSILSLKRNKKLDKISHYLNDIYREIKKNKS